MKFNNLYGYLQKIANNDNSPKLQEQACSILSMLNANKLVDNQETDKVIDADFEKKNPEEANNSESNNLQVEDMIFHKSLPELSLKDENTQNGKFGKLFNTPKSTSLYDKVASAFISDLKVDSLKNNTKKDVFRFLPPTAKYKKIIEYGMVVSELIPKADLHNLDEAEKTIKKEFKDQNRRKLLNDFFEKAKDKYILILNDKIIDGHHFLAKAKELNITSSLKVLDLTPIRFQ